METRGHDPSGVHAENQCGRRHYPTPAREAQKARPRHGQPCHGGSWTLAEGGQADPGEHPCAAKSLPAGSNNTLAQAISEACHTAAPTLEDFANAYRPQGEKLIAAGMNSMLSDKYFGQWLVLHRPFRNLAELADHPDMPDSLPGNYRYFALALLHAATFWRDTGAIEEQMALEAHSRL